MIKVLNDIKRELSEQKKAARLREEDSNENHASQGSEYSDDSAGEEENSSPGPIEFEERQQPVPKATILHYSVFKTIWDWIILLLVLYTAVFTPYIVAFLVNETETFMNLNDDQSTRLKNADYNTADPLVIVDLLVDFMFILDIIINFRTTFVRGGEVVTNSKEIAIHYLKGWFAIDAIAALPLDLLFFGSGTSDTLTYTGALKLVRLFRLLRVYRRADQYAQYAAATLLLLMISFALISHWLACVFYYIAFHERKTLTEPISWLDALADQMKTPYLPNDTTSGPDIQSRYITAMYFVMTALTSIGFGNIAPTTNAEKIFSIIAMLIGSLLSAAIFGNFSSIMMRMYQGSEEVQQKTRSIKDFITFHTIPPELSKRMQEAFLHSWSNTNGVDMNSVLKSFPEQIQADICLHLNKNLLNNNVAFKGASPGCLRALSLRFTTTHAPPGDNLIHPGDIVSSIYFIARGSIEILKDDVCMAILGRGDIFGLSVDDISSVVKSNYSVHALTFCDMNKIEAYDLQDIFDMYPEFTENFKRKFSLTFNLKVHYVEGEYTSLVKPQDMDEETIKLIRQKRPKLQCKFHSPSTPDTPVEEKAELVGAKPIMRRTSTLEESSVSQAITELRPSGLRKAHEPGAVKDSKRGLLTQHKTPSIEEQKPTFRSLILMAAKLQKEKDAEEAEKAANMKLSSHATTTPNTNISNQTETTCERFVHMDHKNVKDSDFNERQHLQIISDRIDECLLKAQRVEQHWNSSVNAIFNLLGHERVKVE